MFWTTEGFWDRMKVEVLLGLFEAQKVGDLVQCGIKKSLIMQILQSVTDRCATLIAESHIIAILRPMEGLFVKDAVRMSSIYPQVQDYIFSVHPFTKCISFLLNYATPRFLRPVARIPCKQDGDAKEILDIFASNYYTKGVLYSIFTQAFVKDYCTIFLLNGAEFVNFLVSIWDQRSITKASVSRLAKRFFLLNSSIACKMFFSLLLKCVGAKVGMAFNKNRHAAFGIFYGQHIVSFVALIPFSFVSAKIYETAVSCINKWFPPTPEEFEEEQRKQREGDEKDQAFAEIIDRCKSDHESYYSVLGVPPNSDLNAIRASYRAQSLKFHPDRVPKTPAAQKEAQEKMALVNEAYEVLQDPERRAFYDSCLSSKPVIIFGQLQDDIVNHLQSMPSIFSIPLSISGVALLSYSTAVVVYTSLYRAFRHLSPPGIYWSATV